jgi:hypothetical protein
VNLRICLLYDVVVGETNMRLQSSITRHRDKDRDRGEVRQPAGDLHHGRDGGGSRRHRSRSRDRSRDERDSGGQMREGGRERNGAHDRGVGRSAMDPSRGDMHVPRDAMRDRDARDVMRDAARDGLKDVARDGMRDVARDAARDPRDAGRDLRDARDLRDGGRDGGRDAHREVREKERGVGGEEERKKGKERREKKGEGKGERRRRDRSRDDKRSRSRERRRIRPDAVAGAVEGAVVSAHHGAEGKETKRLSAADDIKKDGIYWYRDGRDGVEKEVQVVAIDRTVKPPSFTIRVDGRERETEAHRLSLHKSSLRPDAAAVQKGAEGNGGRGGTEEFIVTKVEDGLEYKTADGFVFKLKEKKLEPPQTPLPAENDEEKAKKLKAASEAAAAACMALLRKKEEEAPAAGAAEAAAQSSEASAGAGVAGMRVVGQPTGGAGLVVPASKVMTTLTAAGKALTAAGMVLTPAVGMALAAGENNLFSPGALGVLPSVKRSAQNSAYVRALKEEEVERAQKEEEEAQILKSALYWD